MWVLGLVAVGWLLRPRPSRPSPPDRAGPLDDDSVMTLLSVIRLATAAGLSVGSALDFGLAALGGAATRAERGALAAGNSIDEIFRTLSDRAGGRVLDGVTMSARYGLALEPVLDRAIDEVAARQRRHREIRTRQLPVRLLFPLVMCVLPAFACVGVVPVVLAALRM